MILNKFKQSIENNRKVKGQELLAAGMTKLFSKLHKCPCKTGKTNGKQKTKFRESKRTYSLLELTNEFSKIIRYKINVLNQFYF